MPDTRLITFANPSGPGYRSGSLNREQRRRVAHGDLLPFVEPELRYLDEQKLESVRLGGSSLGFDRAVAVAAHGSQEVTTLTGIEPASSVKRLPPTLVLRLLQSIPPMEKYARSAKLPTYVAARKDQINPVEFMMGIASPTNIALGRMVARGAFAGNIAKALDKQSGMHVTAYSGTKSEMAARGKRRERVVDALNGEFGSRFDWFTLEGEKHTMTDDPHLQAALLLQGMQTSETTQ